MASVTIKRSREGEGEYHCFTKCLSLLLLLWLKQWESWSKQQGAFHPTERLHQSGPTFSTFLNLCCSNSGEKLLYFSRSTCKKLRWNMKCVEIKIIVGSFLGQSIIYSLRRKYRARLQRLSKVWQEMKSSMHWNWAWGVLTMRIFCISTTEGIPDSSGFSPPLFHWGQK